jgi:NAD(P)-dependent dehydrogenase (short-subunit alcohol dehydrogenase family)
VTQASASPQHFAGKVVAVTGGASGIGEAIVRNLIAQGARVAALDINSALLDVRAREFKDSFHKVVGDVTEEAVVAGFVRECVDRFGGLHCAFNVAGSSRSAPITSLAVEDWDFTTNLCLKGVFLSLKHEARQLLAQRTGGAIVNISSLCARMPVYGAAAYCAAKAGVEMLTRVAALELARDRVRVNAVLPGYTDTPGIRNADVLPEFHQTVIERIPLGRASTALEIAEAAVFLAGDEARYITGTSLVVDGGWELTGCPDFRSFLERSPAKK